MESSDVIGEGGYGCVHKPSLKCKTPFPISVSNKRKISKVLFSNFAKKELKEYDNIANIDKKRNFYLGKPIECQFDEKNKENIASLKKCSIGEDMTLSPNDLTLLLMEDGGLNLELYANKYNNIRTTASQYKNIQDIEQFWVEAFRLLLGIKELLHHGVIHNDLKPQNIVYNETNQRVNFIDFGLMTTYKDALKSSIENTNSYVNQMYWAYPIEVIFYNQRSFTKLVQMTQSEREKYIIKLCNDPALRTFFYYETRCITDKQHMTMYLNDLYSFIVHNFNYPTMNEHVIGKTEFENSAHLLLLTNSLSTIDIYGLGISFNYILSKTRHLLNDNLRNDFDKLFYSMITPNPFKRIKIDTLINSYEMILKNNGLFNKYPHKFQSFLLPTQFESKINKVIKGITTSIQTKESIIIKNADKTIFEMSCGNNKTFDLLKKKCVNKCKKGYVRNKKFTCVSKKNMKKTKTHKTKKSGTRKVLRSATKENYENMYVILFGKSKVD